MTSFRPHALAAPGPRLIVLFLAALGALAAGCSSVAVTRTERSGIEQQILVRSLERAIARLDLAPLAGRRVTLELFGLTKDHAFAREYLAAHLESRGVDVVDKPAGADLQLKAFASVLGMDTGETLFGMPALQIPVAAVPIPEIALFKWVRNRGHAELQVFTVDPATGRYVSRGPDGVGRAKYDRFTILLLVNFTVSDLDNRPGPPER